jgi:hypothetical protein
MYIAGGEILEKEDPCDKCYANLKEEKNKPEELCSLYGSSMVGCWEQARAITRCQECEDRCRNNCKTCEFYDEGW